MIPDVVNLVRKEYLFFVNDVVFTAHLCALPHPQAERVPIPPPL